MGNTKSVPAFFANVRDDDLTYPDELGVTILLLLHRDREFYYEFHNTIPRVQYNPTSTVFTPHIPGGTLVSLSGSAKDIRNGVRVDEFVLSGRIPPALYWSPRHLGELSVQLCDHFQKAQSDFLKRYQKPQNLHVLSEDPHITNSSFVVPHFPPFVTTPPRLSTAIFFTIAHVVYVPPPGGWILLHCFGKPNSAHTHLSALRTKKYDLLPQQGAICLIFTQRGEYLSYYLLEAPSKTKHINPLTMSAINAEVHRILDCNAVGSFSHIMQSQIPPKLKSQPNAQIPPFHLRLAGDEDLESIQLKLLLHEQMRCHHTGRMRKNPPRRTLESIKRDPDPDSEPEPDPVDFEDFVGDEEVAVDFARQTELQMELGTYLDYYKKQRTRIHTEGRARDRRKKKCVNVEEQQSAVLNRAHTALQTLYGADGVPPQAAPMLVLSVDSFVNGELPYKLSTLVSIVLYVDAEGVYYDHRFVPIPPTFYAPHEPVPKNALIAICGELEALQHHRYHEIAHTVLYSYTSNAENNGDNAEKNGDIAQHLWLHYSMVQRHYFDNIPKTTPKNLFQLPKSAAWHMTTPQRSLYTDLSKSAQDDMRDIHLSMCLARVVDVGANNEQLIVSLALDDAQTNSNIHKISIPPPLRAFPQFFPQPNSTCLIATSPHFDHATYYKLPDPGTHVQMLVDFHEQQVHCKSRDKKCHSYCTGL